MHWQSQQGWDWHARAARRLAIRQHSMRAWRSSVCTSGGLRPDKRGSVLLHLWRGRVDAGPVTVQGVPTEDMLQVVALLHNSNTNTCNYAHPCDSRDSSDTFCPGRVLT